MHEKINKPFSVSYTISFQGKTKSDGVKTVTAEMIKDKMLGVLVDYLHDGHLEKWTVSAELKKEEEEKKRKEVMNREK